MVAKKDFSLTWLLEPLESHPSFFTKRMFGSLAVYFQDKMVLILSESPGENSYRGETFDFEIWNGLLIPTDRIYHDSLRNQFSELVVHPVLKKWLYLPMNLEFFEERGQELVNLIRKNDSRLGVIPGTKSKTQRKKNPSKKTAKKKVVKEVTSKGKKLK